MFLLFIKDEAAEGDYLAVEDVLALVNQTALLLSLAFPGVK